MKPSERIEQISDILLKKYPDSGLITREITAIKLYLDEQREEKNEEK